MIIMSGNIATGTQGIGAIAKSLHLIHRRKIAKESYLESQGLLYLRFHLPPHPPVSLTPLSTGPCFPNLPKQLYQQQTKHLNIAQEDYSHSNYQ